jgi:hypothetical protein
MKMDATTWLALASKSNEVFGGPGIFLSFPATTPFSYKPEDLNFVDALSNPQVGHILADLSLNVNSLPSGTLFMGPGDNPLWRAYNEWLNDMVLAKDEMTADERSQYDRATALLTVKDTNGFSVDSPIVVKYKQYRDAWFSATQNYKNEQLTANSSSDSAVQTQWTNVREPQLRALVDQATSDWEKKGNKVEVENAQNLRARLAARSPSIAWAEWRSAMNPDIDLITDPVSNMQYAPTAFSPADVFAQDWPTFHLSKDEIAPLTQSAPEELRYIFASGGGASTITSLSFQFRSAALVRPWLYPVWKAQFWKFREGTPQLSDGSTPPQGCWTAYISAVVFARNIVVTTQNAAQPQPLGAFVVSKEMLSLAMQTQAVTVHKNPLIATNASLQKSMVSPLMRLNTSIYRKPIRDFDADSDVPSSSGHTPQPAPAPTPVPAPAPAPTETSTSDNNISILAFICSYLPQSPNQDLTLNW